MIILGLTGSIGMGKSTCAEIFEKMGVPIHDSDKAVHGLLANDPDTIQAVLKAFPELSSSINRSALGKLVFSHPTRRTQLEAILHPRVRSHQQEFLAAQSSEMALLDIPLLFETGADARVDYTIVVSAPIDIQKQRVLARPGMSEEKLAAILSRQMPDEEKKKKADFIIHNDQGYDHLENQITEIIKQVKAQC